MTVWTVSLLSLFDSLQYLFQHQDPVYLTICLPRSWRNTSFFDCRMGFIYGVTLMHGMDGMDERYEMINLRALS